jgi:hypothetical protein
MSFKSFQVEKLLFSTHERNKNKLYVTYDQYGGYGFRILFEPSPLNIFFSNSGVFENLHSNVDMTELLNVNSSYKGRNLLFKKGFFKDMAGFFFLFGSLLMIYMGMTSYKSDSHFFRFGNRVIRLIILEVTFSLLLAVLYLFPRLLGIRFSASDLSHYLSFCCYLLVFLAFFYGLGLLARVMVKQKGLVFMVGFAAWFFSVSIVPELMTIWIQKKGSYMPANEAHNVMKLQEVMTYEREVQKATKNIKTLKQKKEIYKQMVGRFQENGYVKNTRLEEDLNRDIEAVIRQHEKFQTVYPTAYYHFLSGEMSGKGYRAYLDLVNYTLKLRHEFVNFYLEMRYKSGNGKMVPFVKDEENIFSPPVRLPEQYGVGTGITLAYTVLLFLVSYLVLYRRSKRKARIKKPAYQFRKGNTYYILCKDEAHREGLFRAYQEEAATICVGNVQGSELDLDVTPSHLLDYYCRAAGVDPGKARENLALLGVDEQMLKSRRNPKGGQPNRGQREETILAVYCAVLLAGDGDTVVINDLLKGKSRQLEGRFLQLVSRLSQAGKIIVYLGCEIFLTSMPFQGDIKLDSYKSFKIDPLVVSLR